MPLTEKGRSYLSVMRMGDDMTKIGLLLLPDTFLNGDLQKIVFMTQPEGFIFPENINKVC